MAGGEYVVECSDGKSYRAITADHARAIAIAELEAQKVSPLQQQVAAQAALIEAQKQQLAAYAKLADLDSRLVGLDSKLIALSSQMQQLMTQQHADATALISGQHDMAIAGRPNWFEKLMKKVPVEIGGVGLQWGANARGLFAPPNPCQAEVTPLTDPRYNRHR